MNINFKFDLFKFGSFHNPTEAIEIRENKGLLSNMILGFLDHWPLMIKLSSITQKLRLKPNFSFLKQIPKTIK